MQGLEGKTFIIAGGATGIGAGTAKRLATEGASVAVGDINIAEAKATVETITATGAVPSPSSSTSPMTTPSVTSSTPRSPNSVQSMDWTTSVPTCRRATSDVTPRSWILPSTYGTAPSTSISSVSCALSAPCFHISSNEGPAASSTPHLEVR
jgi:NAD(P)-dependent dehydrogenase (short-subunit alcohol dehydrogenase family)